MKRYIKCALSMILIIIAFNMVWFYLSISLFGNLITDPFWSKLLSSIATLCYICIIYTTAAKMGLYDQKPYHNIRPYKLKGVAIFLPAVAISTLLLIGLIITKQNPSKYNAFTFIELAFSLWNYAYIAFIDLSDAYFTITEYILILAVCPLFSFLGYLAGMHKFSFLDSVVFKLIYKNHS